MEEQLISFDTAKLAKEKRFLKEWADLAYKKDDQKLYGDTGIYTDYPAPTQSLLQKWLREIHKIFINIIYDGNDEVFRVQIVKQNNYNIRKVLFIKKEDYIIEFFTYEEAMEKGLQEALKLLDYEYIESSG